MEGQHPTVQSKKQKSNFLKQLIHLTFVVSLNKLVHTALQKLHSCH